jgi:hypothetical protein
MKVKLLSIASLAMVLTGVILAPWSLAQAPDKPDSSTPTEGAFPPPVRGAAMEWNGAASGNLEGIEQQALLLPPPPPWRLLMSEDFEGPFTSAGWTAFDKDGATHGEYYWDDDDYKPHGGTYSAWCTDGGANGLDPASHDYPNYADTWIIYGPFSLLNYSNARLNFYYWLDSEATYDFFGWWASTGGLYYGYVTSGNSSGWQYVSFDLTAVPTLGDVTGESQVWIAFTFASDASVVYKGAFVDDVELWGYYEGGDLYLPLVIRNMSTSPAARYPNDYHASVDWELAKVHAPEAWGFSTGDGAVIAIIDNGVNFTHPDLDEAIWTNTGEVPGNSKDDDDNDYADDVHGYDFYYNDPDPSDGATHGTGVALVAGAETNNGYGDASIGWNAQIMALKIGGTTSWSPSAMRKAIRYARKNGADVINMSLWGSGSCSTDLQDEIDAAYNEGIVLIASGDGNLYPANCNHVIGVSATDAGDNVVLPGAGSDYIDVAAPGTSTSHAAPMVAGLAALLKAHHPGYSSDQIADAILCNADYIGYQSNRTGNGRMNAYRSLLNGAVGCSPSY